ncbi:hypothetical protein SS50377_26032 [Spironucleus salmonicida]|uniref:Uncharacterized protein n=1 Tax=Spironucleus salmonicida TaxID=348837 RepID=V6LD13_9EUKA|nr:hypothetical protein SS50377_26032 [Spironucleus salmonicida]|eukprot:EST42347.1 Hypothetical protein SS50377_18136 [Spironucleus salmonicida]
MTFLTNFEYNVQEISAEPVEVNQRGQEHKLCDIKKLRDKPQVRIKVIGLDPILNKKSPKPIFRSKQEYQEYPFQNYRQFRSQQQKKQCGYTSFHHDQKSEYQEQIELLAFNSIESVKGSIREWMKVTNQELAQQSLFARFFQE